MYLFEQLLNPKQKAQKPISVAKLKALNSEKLTTYLSKCRGSPSLLSDWIEVDAKLDEKNQVCRVEIPIWNYGRKVKAFPLRP